MSSSSSTGTPAVSTGTAVSGFSTLGDVLEEFRPMIGGRTGSGDSKLVRYINQVVADIANSIPPDALLFDFSITTIVGTTVYTLDQASFRYKSMMPEQIKFTAADGTETAIGYIPYDTWRDWKIDRDFTVSGSNSNGSVMSVYSVLPKTVQDRTQIEFYQAPTSVGVVNGKFTYWAGRVSLGEDSTTIPLPPECQSVFELGMEAKTKDDTAASESRIANAYARFEQKLNETTHEMIKDQVSKWGGHVNPYPPRVIDNPNDFSNLTGTG